MQSAKGGVSADVLAPRKGPESSRRSSNIVWGVALLWLAMLAWSAHLVSTVGTLRRELADGVTWRMRAEQLRREITGLRDASGAAGPAGAVMAFPGSLRDTLIEGRVLRDVPLSENEAEEARLRWRSAATRLALAADGLVRSSRSGAVSRRVDAVEEAARDLQAAIHELDRAVRNGSGARATALGEKWESLYVLAALSLCGLGALALILIRMHRQSLLLRTKERQFRVLVQTAQDLIWSVDAEGRIVFVNEAVQRVYGRTPEEVTGRRFSEFRPLAHVAAAQEAFRRVLDGETISHHETTGVRKDGSEVSLLVNASPVRDSRGRVVGAMGTTSDVTELRQMQTTLLRNERLQAVATLSGGFAHDFNNLLTVIIGQAEVARAKEHLGAALERRMSSILQTAERARKLTQQLMAFACRQPLQKEVIDLGSVVRHMDELIEGLAGEEIEVRAELPETPVRALADWSQLDQVLMNLVVNARDAMPEGGRVVISVQQRELGAQEAGDLGVAPGAWAAIEVRDEGTGMTQSVIDHIFEPFFTTKEHGKGTGLGLATVHGVVRQHDGCVKVTSAPGEGTTICVLLPAVLSAVGSEPLAVT